jgi:hypothetical protein
MRGAPAFTAYQNRIKSLSNMTIGVVRRAKSRFPRLLERLKKLETEWKVWKEASRAQGRCATRLRYAPTFAGLFILKYFPAFSKLAIRYFRFSLDQTESKLLTARWPAGSTSAEPRASSAEYLLNTIAVTRPE